MALADDIVAALAKPPYADAPVAPEPARTEALARARRAQATFDRDPRGALEVFLEAIDLDPSCKLAYEGIAKLALGRASDSRPAVEAAVRYVEVGQKRLPEDAELKDLLSRLRQLLPKPDADAAIARTGSSGRAPAAQKPRIVGKPTRTCEYCGSPIPAGADACKSCQMSGEIPKPGAPAAKKGCFGVLAFVALLALGSGS